MSRAVLFGSAAGLSLGLAVNAFLPLLSPTLTVYELSSLLTIYWQYPIYFALFCLSLNLYYRIFVKPLDGFHPLTPELRDRAMNRMNNKELPPPFPTSWWKIMNSHELKIGESRPITVFGEELVIYRAAGDEKTGEGRGMVHILDAYCPHLGAHLGVGGKVVGNCIECPFHGWCFDGTGTCTSIPYSDKAPPEQARVHSWPVCEVNHQIFVWYTADRKNPSASPSSLEPTWKIPEISNVANWKFHGEVVHEISCHVQEIPENGADVAHLTFLHGPFLLQFLPFLRHVWDASYTPLPEPNAHLATLNLKTAVSAFGKVLGFTTVYSHIVQVGPGIVHLEFPTIFGRVCAIETITPQHPYVVRACNLVLAEPWVPRFVAKFFLKSIVMQFSRDVPIWCQKRFVRAPMQVKGDGPLLQYRRWYRQFYTQQNLLEYQQKSKQEQQQETNNNASVAPATAKAGLEW